MRGATRKITIWMPNRQEALSTRVMQNGFIHATAGGTGAGKELQALGFSRSSRTYPTPRTVWINFFSNGPSTFARRFPILTSTIFRLLSNPRFQIRSAIRTLERASPVQRIRRERSANSLLGQLKTFTAADSRRARKSLPPGPHAEQIGLHHLAAPQ